jgi:periplasmic protein TonB
VATAFAYPENRFAWRGGAGIAVSIAIHAALIGVLLFARAPETIPPQPLSVNVLSEAPSQRLQPPPTDYKPTQQVPLLRAEMPEIEIIDTAPAQAAPVSVSITAPAEAAPPAPSEPRFDADYLNNPAPRYPALSRRLREEGVVLVRVHVLPSGQPDVVELKRSSGSSRLDESALTTVRQWRFVPARRGSEAVAAWVVVPVAFSLA